MPRCRPHPPSAMTHCSGRRPGAWCPTRFTHGSAEQRKRWFMTGFQQGTVNACNTFGASSL